MLRLRTGEYAVDHPEANEKLRETINLVLDAREVFVTEAQTGWPQFRVSCPGHLMVVALDSGKSNSRDHHPWLAGSLLFWSAP